MFRTLKIAAVFACTGLILTFMSPQGPDVTPPARPVAPVLPVQSNSEGLIKDLPPRPPTPARTPARAASRSRVSSEWARSAVWASTAAARRVADCESDAPTDVNPSGKYRGKWQMDRDFWKKYGGLRFASRPELATEAQQDLVAYRGWKARGWQPWECRKVLR